VPVARKRLHLLGVVCVWPGLTALEACALLGWRKHTWTAYRLLAGGWLRSEHGRLHLTRKGELLLEDSTRRLGYLPGPTRRGGKP